MLLYLVRHGEAGSAFDDFQRRLTDHGKMQVMSVCEKLKNSNLKIDNIFHSGLVRAQQTSEIISQNLFNSEITPERAPNLSPEDDVTIWGKKVGETNKNIMLVGHMPFMGNLAEYLLNFSEEVVFKTANVACLKRSDLISSWKLLWKFTP
ncbi:MAG: phosphohistidine phosphatase SixA [Bacteriovoracaceae bacterium]|nr:phosphohistidine phosphatase SixA [Bacteriovoracaceae bacterium]